MNVTKCLNGHFFDADKYNTCPHCGANADNGGNGEKKEKSHKSFFGRKEEKSNEVKVNNVPSQAGSRTFGLFSSDTQNEQGIYRPVKKTSEETLKENAVYKPAQNAIPVQKAQPIQSNESVQKSEPVMKQPQVNVKQDVQSVVQTPDANVTPMIKPAVTMQEEIKQIASVDEGKTVGYFSTGPSVVNSGASMSTTSSEPVVGWLICVKGAHFGESFVIVSGRNSMGRASGNHIVFSKEPGVSREKHAWITYEPKKREFYIQPGESSGLTYLNGDNIMAPQKLNAFDQLELGDGTFLLVPLCGENFTWDEYINRGE